MAMTLKRVYNKREGKQMTNSSTHSDQRLEEKINSCKSGSRIDLRTVKLTDSNMELIIKEAIMKKQCSMLWLTDNQITSQGLVNLASALHHSQALEGLSLCNNQLTDANIRCLTEALSDPKLNLKRLALTSNKITDQGAQYLAEMLQVNRTLTQLWLGFNQITDHGVQFLTGALMDHNKTLQIFSLASNRGVTDASVQTLLTMMEYNRTLTTVCLSNCKFSSESKSQLREGTKLYNEFYLDL